MAGRNGAGVSVVNSSVLASTARTPISCGVTSPLTDCVQFLITPW